MSGKPKKNTAMSICSVLRQRILDWEYVPGQRFTEQALCDEFKVSRVPVREALSMLIDTGLVTKERNVGCRVRKIMMEDINHLYELRIALELYAVEVLADRPDAPFRIAGLKAEWEGHSNWSEDEGIDPVFWSDADERFHEGLVEQINNPELSRALHDVNDQIRFLRVKDITTFERLMKTCKAHEDILDAIEQGNPNEARKLLHHNILMGRNNVQESFKEVLIQAYS